MATITNTPTSFRFMIPPFIFFVHILAKSEDEFATKSCSGRPILSECSVPTKSSILVEEERNLQVLNFHDLHQFLDRVINGAQFFFSQFI